MTLRENIIAEATKTFLTYGVKSIRMDDLATNLGISKRTIYEIFGDKETLVTECIESHFEKVKEEKQQKMMKAGNIIEEFLVLLKDWDSDFETNYRVMTSVRKFYPKIYAKIGVDHSKTGYPELKEKLKRGVEDGLLLSNIDYDLAISVFSHSLFGVVTEQKMILPENVSQVDAFKYIVTYFLRGISTTKGIKLIDDFIENERKKKTTKK